MISVLEKHQARHRIIVTSFRHDLVAVCASFLEVNCGLLLAHRPRTLDSLLADLNATAIPGSTILCGITKFWMAFC